MQLYAAIDLHSNNSVLAVIDEHNALQLRRKLPNDIEVIRAALERFREQLVGVVVESTFNWYWLVDGLMESGYTLHLANTAAVPQYSGLKHSNDDSDARHLADLLRLGILPKGFIYPQEQRRVRDLLRQRLRLVQKSAGLMQSVQGLFSRLTGHGMRANDFRDLDYAQLERLLPHALDRHAALAPMHVWGAARQQIEAIEKVVREELRDRTDFKKLKSAPGIGDILGSTILLETGPIERFSSVGDYASYCRMVDSAQLSNGKKKGEGNRKCGNRYLCWAYIEAANFAIRYYEPVRRWYAVHGWTSVVGAGCAGATDRKASKRHRIVALKAVAHKIARGCYHALRD